MRLVVAAIMITRTAFAADCGGTTVGTTPLTELGAGTYLGMFQGGLYPGGSNAVPAEHHATGLAAASAITPLDTNGQPNAAGKVVLLSVGMSNASQEFGPFQLLADAHPDVEADNLVIVNGAQGGATADDWRSPTANTYNDVETFALTPQGLSEAQVQAVWLKNANPNPDTPLPDTGADAFALTEAFGDIARALRVRYPNVRVVFLTSRTYAGYASTPLSPEPYSYESGFSVKWTVEAQIDQQSGAGIDALAGDLAHPASAPWLAWGPYLWADGETARSDGLQWFCSDFESDGTHPGPDGEAKVGQLLLEFFLTSPYTVPWFTESGVSPEPEISTNATGGGFYEEGETIRLGLPQPHDAGGPIQWFRNGAPLSNGGRINGANNAELTIAPAQAGDTANYSATYDNGAKSVATAFVSLTVVSPGALPALGVAGVLSLVLSLALLIASFVPGPRTTP